MDGPVQVWTCTSWSLVAVVRSIEEVSARSSSSGSNEPSSSSPGGEGESGTLIGLVIGKGGSKSESTSASAFMVMLVSGGVTGRPGLHREKCSSSIFSAFLFTSKIGSDFETFYESEGICYEFMNLKTKLTALNLGGRASKRYNKMKNEEVQKEL